MKRFSRSFPYLISLVNLVLLVVLVTNGGSLVGATPMLQTGAVAPPYLSYQGFLRDPEGNLLTGSYTLTFRTYDDPAKPVDQALWVEEHPDVTVRDGYFSVLLGDITPLPDTAFGGTNAFIGVTIAGYDEMVPRQRFTSVPYAVVAAQAEQAETANRASRAYGLAASDGNPADAAFVDERGYVGINTTSPKARLHVSGDLRISGDLLDSSGSKLIHIHRFIDIGNDADILLPEPVSDTCVVAGWSARYDHIPGTGDSIAWTYKSISNNRLVWRLRVSFHSGLGDNESPDVDVICFDNDIVSFTGHGQGDRDLWHNDPR